MRRMPYEKLTEIFDTVDDTPHKPKLSFVVVTNMLERPVSSG